ncbi:YdeI/OmpD-associated family protein [Glycomyces rhizosphaerae]|uniref:YdeI family protein n=1 Tax=Glycomyces rhizosphaerae TaxID=2054422 RepID=A0ABV7PZP6_9ACTN
MSVEVLDFADGDEWEAWLEAHPDEREVWLRIGKERSPEGRLRIGPALESALCFGWIDGHRKALDGDSFLQRYSPRTKRSPWSRRNRGIAEALIAAGRMRPAGLAEIERAKAEGRWPADD